MIYQQNNMSFFYIIIKPQISISLWTMHSPTSENMYTLLSSTIVPCKTNIHTNKKNVINFNIILLSNKTTYFYGNCKFSM